MALDLTAVTGALTALKTLTSIAKDVNSVELTQQVVELQQKLLDIQIDFGEMIEENRALKAEIENAKATQFHHAAYWKRQGDEELGPFCPICYGEKKLLMQLRYIGPHGTDKTASRYRCPSFHNPLDRPGMEPSYAIPNDLLPENRYNRSGHT